MKWIPRQRSTVHKQKACWGNGVVKYVDSFQEWKEVSTKCPGTRFVLGRRGSTVAKLADVIVGRTYDQTSIGEGWTKEIGWVGSNDTSLALMLPVHVGEEVVEGDCNLFIEMEFRGKWDNDRVGVRVMEAIVVERLAWDRIEVIVVVYINGDGWCHGGMVEGEV